MIDTLFHKEKTNNLQTHKTQANFTTKIMTYVYIYIHIHVYCSMLTNKHIQKTTIVQRKMPIEATWSSAQVASEPCSTVAATCVEVERVLCIVLRSEGIRFQHNPLNQWPFQEPKLEVPTIYVWPIFQAEISGNIPTKYGQKYGTFTYLQVLDPGISIDSACLLLLT